MARAYNIFIVSRPSEGRFVAAFTVKHECTRFLERAVPIAELKDHKVTRVPDGDHPNVQIRSVMADDFIAKGGRFE